ncbi:ChbG/HpnK family deacetylase [Escherichia coli]
MSYLDAKPTHLDSHHHVHMFPRIFSRLFRFAAEEGIALRTTVRTPLVIYRLICAVRRDSVARFMVKRLARHCSCKCWMIQPSRERSLEVMCHPAFVDNLIRKSAYCFPRLTELEVLTSASLKYAIAERGYRLGSYLDV